MHECVGFCLVWGIKTFGQLFIDGQFLLILPESKDQAERREWGFQSPRKASNLEWEQRLSFSKKPDKNSNDNYVIIYVTASVKMS